MVGCCCCWPFHFFLRKSRVCKACNLIKLWWIQIIFDKRSGRYDDIKPIYLHLILNDDILFYPDDGAAATATEMHKNDNLFSSASSICFWTFCVNKMLLGDLEWQRKFFSRSAPPATFCYPNLFIFPISRESVDIFINMLLTRHFSILTSFPIVLGRIHEELFNWMGNYAACWRQSGLTSLIHKSSYK